MASPVADTYSSASGVVKGGRTFAPARPAWRRAIAANTWGTIPGNKLSDVDPKLDPVLNPGNLSAPRWDPNARGQEAIMTAWNGMAYDYDTDTMWFPLQGGHADYAGNEPYKRRLDVDVPNFVRLRAPSGSGANPIVLDDGQQASGIYSDGRPRSVHSYNNNIYVPGYGPYISRMAGPYPGQASPYKTWLINETTGEATYFMDYYDISMGGELGSSCAYDPTRQCLWLMGVGTTGLMKLNPATKAITAVVGYANLANGDATRLIYAPGDDALIFLHLGGAGYPPSLFLWDLTTSPPTRINVTVSGTPLVNINGVTGSDWDAANKRLLMWGVQANRQFITTLTPTGNMKNTPWVAGTLPIASNNTVVPTASTASGGVYTRFRYSPRLGGCILINRVDEPTYFFATE